MSCRVFQPAPRLLRWGQLKHSPLSYILVFVKQYLISLKMYIYSMNDGLSDDIKKQVHLGTEDWLHDPKDKMLHSATVCDIIDREGRYAL